MPRKCDYTKTSSLENVAYDFSYTKEDDMPCQQSMDYPQGTLCSNTDNFNPFNCNYNDNITSSPQLIQPSKPSDKQNFSLNLVQNYLTNKHSLPLAFSSPKQKRQKFTHEEDEIIINLVGDTQFPNWNEIASHIKGKSGRQCRERFQHYLSPKLSREPWTPQEDQLIRTLYNQYGPNWALIAEHFNGKRTNNNIKNRFNNHIKLLKNIKIQQINNTQPSNFVLNQPQKNVYSPQPPMISPQPPIFSSPQPMIPSQTQFNFNNIAFNNGISNSPSEPIISLTSIPKSANTSFSANEEVPDDSLLLTDDGFNINDMNTDQLGLIDFEKLECDELCDFNQNMDTFEYFPDFMNDFK